MRESATVPRNIIQDVKFPKVRQVTLHSLSAAEHGIDKNILSLDFVPSSQTIKRLHEYQKMQNKISEEKAWFNKELNSPYGTSTKPDVNVVRKLHSFLLQHSDGQGFMKPFTIGEDVASLFFNRWVSLGLVQAFIKIMNATESSSRALILNN